MEYTFDRLVRHTVTLLFFLLQTVFVPEEADFGSRQEMGCMSELQNNYAQHEMYKHLCTPSEERQFTIDLHKKSSMRHYVSKKHLQSHREEQALACDVCKKIFKCPNALKLHVCSCTGEKPWACDVCKKTFMMSGNLKAHLHAHAGQQPFTCGVCKKSLNPSGTLKLHHALILGSSCLHVVYVRNLTLSQVT
jgi:hypothetical protein